MERSGDELARAFRDGDEEAFDALMATYQERLYRTAHRLLGRSDLAMDAVQDAFVTVYRDIGKWNGRSRFYTWLYRVTVNKAIDRLRKEKRDRAVIQRLAEGPVTAPDGVADLIERDEQAHRLARVREAIEKLPEAQRVTMVLRHYEGRSLKEIAAIRGCSIGTVKSTLFQAFRRLLDLLGEEAPAPAEGRRNGREGAK